MSRRDDTISLRQMLDHTREAVALTDGRSRATLDQDRVLSLALTHLVQIIGEAANRVSPGCQSLHPEIEWRQIVAFRNRLVHGYDAVDVDILWQILTVDLPPVISRLQRIISSPEG